MTVTRYELWCLHTNSGEDIEVKEGDIMACSRCGLNGEVIKVYERDWHYYIRCDSCRYGSNTGQSFFLAKLQKGKHELKYPSHEMKLEKVYDD